MAQDIQKLYQTLQPLLTRDILRTSQRREDLSQYKTGSLQFHKHNGIDSPPVNYPTLGNVKSYLISTTRILTQAEITSLFTTPVVLIQQPGIRSVIIVHSVTARLTYSGLAPYTGANNLEFRYTDGSGTKVTADIPAAFINSSADAFAHAPAVTAEFTPIEGGSGPNGQIVVCVPTANPGAIETLTTTAPILSGATTATLTSVWAFATRHLDVAFSDGEIRSVLFTNGSAAISWTPVLVSNVTTALLLLDFNYSSITLVVHYHVVSYQT